MKLRPVMLVILFFVGMYSPGYGQDTLIVMSYNIYHGEKYYDRGQSNLEGIARLIKKIKPDLVALQEVDSLTGRSASLNGNRPVNQVEELGKRTGMHSYFGKAMDYDGGGYGEGILSDRPLAHSELLLPTPKGGEPRVLLTVSYPLENGKSLVFGGTHLCHQYEENRTAQMETINRYFEGQNSYVMLAGDFNFTPDSRPYAVTARHWKDAAVLANRTEPTIPYDNPTKRIDYFFLSPHDWHIIDMKVLKENNSDHMPLLMKVVVP